MATSDVVLIGHHEKVAGSAAGTTEWRLYADEVLAGSFVPERAFTFMNWASNRSHRDWPRKPASVRSSCCVRRRVRTEDIAAALEVVDAALASKEKDWSRKILEESRQVLLERAKAAFEPRK